MGKVVKLDPGNETAAEFLERIQHAFQTFEPETGFVALFDKNGDMLRLMHPHLTQNDCAMIAIRCLKLVQDVDGDEETEPNT